MILYVLLGPTAVGKTELALQMAEKLGSPILNCDSRQIYRGMEIGTAAPTKEQQNRVRVVERVSPPLREILHDGVV